MKAIPFQRASDASSLRLENWPEPEAKTHEILIQVRAFGVNFADILARKGEYGDAPHFPFIPGYEVAGVVNQLGSNVKKFKVGDAVLALTHFGGYAEYAVADERAAVLKPKNLNFVHPR
ncbi:MAG TPA: alcohol dehydrogenase catalytic domain-containing protein [Turneriella sp.]|nr:alcohol dehydrogenase catalytic domain-containing protein [Turneriella sp.]